MCTSMDHHYWCTSSLPTIILIIIIPFTLFPLPPPFRSHPSALTSLLPFSCLLHFLLLPFAPGVAHGEEEQQALFCSSGLSSSCRTQMVIMELHINWLCWKLTVAVKGSRQPVPVCPCARWCIGSSWWTRCLHSAQLLLRSAQKWYGGSLISMSLYFQPVPSCLLTFCGSEMCHWMIGMLQWLMCCFSHHNNIDFIEYECLSGFIVFTTRETSLVLTDWVLSVRTQGSCLVTLNLWEVEVGRMFVPKAHVVSSTNLACQEPSNAVPK